MKIEEKNKARKMRQDGKSLAYIANKLGVAKSSVSMWTRDIILTDEQKIQLSSLYMSGIEKGINANIKKWQILREEARNIGRKMVVSVNADLFKIGCMLYWAEGRKSRHTMGFANSDPIMIKFFVKFLKECFKLEDEDISLYINCFNDVRTVSDIENFWLQNCGLKTSCLRKTTVNKYSKYSQKKRKGKLEYGTCYIQVNNYRIVQSIYGGINEITGSVNVGWM